MTSAVSFGKLTFAAKCAKSDLLTIYMKNVKKLKESDLSKLSAAKAQNIALNDAEIKESLEKARKENHKFGELTGINDDYYRPMEKVVSRIDDAKEEDSKMLSFSKTNSEMEEIRKSVEEAQADAERV